LKCIYIIIIYVIMQCFNIIIIMLACY